MDTSRKDGDRDMVVEHETIVKHLDFADVTITETLPIGRVSKDLETSTLPPPKSNQTSNGLAKRPQIHDLKEEAQHIVKNLEELDGVFSLLEACRKPQQGESVLSKSTVEELEEHLSSLKSEYLELATTEETLKLLKDFNDGDKLENDQSLPGTETETEVLQKELLSLKQSNSETMKEVEALLRRVSDEMNIFGNNFTYLTERIADQQLEVRKLEEIEQEKQREAMLMINQADGPEDLDETIRLLEEQLQQNEKEYEETEAALKQRIEQYNLEMEEVRAQTKQLDTEEESLRMLVDVSERCLRKQMLHELYNDVAVLAVGDDFVDLQLTTVQESCKDNSTVSANQELRHKLNIKFDSTTMGITSAELTPEVVPVADLVQSVRQIRRSNSDDSNNSFKDAETGEFNRQFVILVRGVHHRISVSLLTTPSSPTNPNNYRFCVEFLPDYSVVTATVPGKFKALLEVPQGWPLHGFSLRVLALKAFQDEKPATLEFMDEMKELANQIPEYGRHDVLSFVQSIENLILEKNALTRILSW